MHVPCIASKIKYNVIFPVCMYLLRDSEGPVGECDKIQATFEENNQTENRRCPVCSNQLTGMPAMPNHPQTKIISGSAILH